MITITRKLSIINGFVEIPNSKAQGKTAVTDSEVNSIIPIKTVSLTNGGRPRHNQKFIEFPAFDRSSGYPNDWFKEINHLI